MKPLQGDKGFDAKAGRSTANQGGHRVLPFPCPAQEGGGCRARIKSPAPARMLWSTRGTPGMPAAPQALWDTTCLHPACTQPSCERSQHGKRLFNGQERLFVFSAAQPGLEHQQRLKQRREKGLSSTHTHRVIPHACTLLFPHFFFAELARTVGAEPGKTAQPYHPIQEVSL